MSSAGETHANGTHDTQSIAYERQSDEGREKKWTNTRVLRWLTKCCSKHGYNAVVAVAV